jgi:hypothetical protein
MAVNDEYEKVLLQSSNMGMVLEEQSKTTKKRNLSETGKGKGHSITGHQGPRGGVQV